MLGHVQGWMRRLPVIQEENSAMITCNDGLGDGSGDQVLGTMSVRAGVQNLRPK